MSLGGENMQGRLKIDELTFSAAHYLKGHPKCRALHGHTYFVKNIEITYETLGQDFIDLGIVESIVVEFDHKLLVPREDAAFWAQLNLSLKPEPPCTLPFVIIPGGTLVENIAEFIATKIKSIKHVRAVKLQVFEGPNQGATCQIGGE